MSIIKSFSVGNGDMYYIKHNSNNFTMIDCYLTDENREAIVTEIEKQKRNKAITRFISTHPDDDHIGGLAFLDDRIGILNFYCVKNKYDENNSDDYTRYYELRDDVTKPFYIHRGCKRRWMNDNDVNDIEKNYGRSGIDILWPITDNKYFIEALKIANEGGNVNNISPIIKYSLQNGVTMLWFGDLEEKFMETIKNSIALPSADIIFAPHHGRDKFPQKWLDEIKPKIIVIGEAPAKHLHYYSNYNTIKQNSAGDITFNCIANKVHIFVSNEKYGEDFLEMEEVDTYYGNYIGTLKV